MRIDKDLVAASATPLVLGILADGESYGYAILKRVNELSAGRMTWTDGMLYPLLHRLERLGYVQAMWHEAPTGRRRRHYAITGAGRSSAVHSTASSAASTVRVKSLSCPYSWWKTTWSSRAPIVRVLRRPSCRPATEPCATVANEVRRPGA